MDSTSLSLVIITYNQEQSLERCIRSVPFASDIVVLDSGSQDRTADLAKRLGARVRIEPWRGHLQQRTRATALALHDWVLCLDADEALSPELQDEIRGIKEKGFSGAAYSMPRVANYLGQWIRFGEGYPDHQVRLFNKNLGQWQSLGRQEVVQAENPERLKGALHRWTYRDLSHQIRDADHEAGLKAQELHAGGVKISKGALLTKPFLVFLKKYFLGGYGRHGLVGLVLAWWLAFSEFLVLAKIYEMDQRR